MSKSRSSLQSVIEITSNIMSDALALSSTTTTAVDSGGEGGSGLSTGAVVGIAVGSAAAGILLLVAAVLIFRLRWKKKRVLVAGAGEATQGKPELDATAVVPGVQPQQSAGTQGYAFEVANTPMAPNRGPYEVDGSLS